MKPEKQWALFYWGGNLLYLLAVAYAFLVMRSVLWTFVPLIANFIWIYCWCSLAVLRPVSNKGQTANQ